MKSPFQAMLTDFDEGESHFSQADLGTSTWEWRQFLLSMTDQDLTGGKNSSSTAPNCSSKYSNHETSDDIVKHSTMYKYFVMIENSIRLEKMIFYLGVWMAFSAILPAHQSSLLDLP